MLKDQAKARKKQESSNKTPKIQKQPQLALGSFGCAFSFITILEVSLGILHLLQVVWNCQVGRGCRAVGFVVCCGFWVILEVLF